MFIKAHKFSSVRALFSAYGRWIGTNKLIYLQPSSISVCHQTVQRNLPYLINSRIKRSSLTIRNPGMFRDRQTIPTNRSIRAHEIKRLHKAFTDQRQIGRMT